LRPQLFRVLTSILVGSLVAAPAVPALAGESETQLSSGNALAARAFAELGASDALVSAIMHPDSPQRLYPYVRPVGDLDGDGANDVVSFTRSEDPDAVLTITARRGTDGSQIFSRSLGTDGAIALLESGPVGPSGGRGILLGLYDFVAMGGGVGSGGSGVSTDPYGERPFGYGTVGVNVSLSLIALGGDGAVTWQRTFTDGRFAYTGLTLALVQDLPILAGSLQALPGAARDLTVSLYDRTPTADNSQDDSFQLQTIDGTDGRTVATRSLDIDNTEAPVAVGPDLDGDGLDDLTVQLLPAAGETPVSTPTLVAVRGTDGAELYRSGSLPLSRSMSLNDVGDLTGDGIADFTLAQPGLRERSGPAQQVVLVNGKTGAALLSTDADTARALGDIDGDGVAEVLLARAFDSNATAEVEYQAVDASGAILWDRSFSVTGISDANSSLLAAPGDVNGDGTPDVSHNLNSRKDTSSSEVNSDLRVISGKTGQTIRTGLPVAEALGASFDGDGDDLAVVARFGVSALDVSGVDGKTGAPLFTTRLRPRGSETRSDWLFASDLTGDGRTDLIVNTESVVKEGPQIEGVTNTAPDLVWDGFVIDGRTGALLWSTDAPGLPTEPDLKGAASPASPYSWNGPRATGVNQTTNEVECRSEPSALCQDILVEVSSPLAQGESSATRVASVVLDEFGPVVEPATDIDLYVHESDELATVGSLVDYSASGGGNPVDGFEGEKVTFEVTTTTSQPSHFYLVRVVYYQSVESGYRGRISLA
jgi:hypothetical protein